MTTEEMLAQCVKDGQRMSLQLHILEEQNNFDEAERKYLEALDIDEQVYGKTHPHLVSPLKSLQRLYNAKGDAARAQEIQKRIEKLDGKDM